jgi:hypothetical protein
MADDAAVGTEGVLNIGKLSPSGYTSLGNPSVLWISFANLIDAVARDEMSSPCAHGFSRIASFVPHCKVSTHTFA